MVQMPIKKEGSCPLLFPIGKFPWEFPIPHHFYNLLLCFALWLRAHSIISRCPHFSFCLIIRNNSKYMRGALSSPNKNIIEESSLNQVLVVFPWETLFHYVIWLYNFSQNFQCIFFGWNLICCGLLPVTALWK